MLLQQRHDCGLRPTRSAAVAEKEDDDEDNDEEEDGDGSERSRNKIPPREKTRVKCR